MFEWYFILLYVGQEVVFLCRDEGLLRAQVTWERGNGLPLPPGFRINITEGRLEIPNIQVSGFIFLFSPVPRCIRRCLWATITWGWIRVWCFKAGPNFSVEEKNNDILPLASPILRRLSTLALMNCNYDFDILLPYICELDRSLIRFLGAVLITFDFLFSVNRCRIIHLSSCR